MLRIASDAPSIRHLLLALGQEGQGEPGSPPLAKAAAGTLGTLPGNGSIGGSEEDEPGGASPGSGSASSEARELSIGKSPFEQAVVQAAPPAGLPVRLAHPSQRIASAASSQEMDAEAVGKGAPPAAPVGRQRRR